MTGNKECEKNKEIVRRVWEEVVNEGKLDIVDELFHLSYIEHIPGGIAKTKGPERIKRAVSWMKKVFPDLHYTIEDIIAEGDRVVSRVTGRGTHKGEFMGVPATERKVEMTAVVISRIKDGKIIEDWSYQNTFDMLKQIGDVSIKQMSL
jgi:steroid delta-isomerase-like uncharacterized protein